MKLAHAVEVYLSGLANPSTHVQYRWILDRFVELCEGHGVTELDQVATAEVLAFRDAQLGFSQATWTHRVAVVRTFLNTCERAGWLDRSPAAHIRLPAPRSKRKHSTLSVEEQRRVIAAAASERDRLLLTLLFATGARIGELCAARVGDWDGRQLRLCGKTGERHVPLADPVVVQLGSYLGRRAANADAPLVGGRQGGLTTSQGRRIFSAACLRAGLAARGPHQARHAAATRWVVDGVPIMVVAALLGHARVSTTVDFYLHASEELMRSAVSQDSLLAA